MIFSLEWLSVRAMNWIFCSIHSMLRTDFCWPLYYWVQNNWIYIRIVSANVHNAIIKSFLSTTVKGLIFLALVWMDASLKCMGDMHMRWRDGDFLITKYNAKSVVFIWIQLICWELCSATEGTDSTILEKPLSLLYEIKISWKTQNALKICVWTQCRHYFNINITKDFRNRSEKVL